MVGRAIRYAKESSVESRVVNDARCIYGLRSIKMQLRFDAGWPDRLFLLPGGRCLWVEFKAPGKPRAPLQENRHATLLELGHDVITMDDYAAAMAAIKERINGVPD